MLHLTPDHFRHLSHLHINPVAKVFFISEAFFWSGWNILLPLISVFALKEITNATIETISFAYSSYLLMRVVGSITSGVILGKLPQSVKNWSIIIGILAINLPYLGFIIFTSIPSMYVFYALTGLLTGLISPLRAAMFSTHMDKHQETKEWGLLDAIVLTTISIAAALSGLLVTHHGYQSVFILSIILNTTSVIPYFYLISHKPIQKVSPELY